MSEAKTVEIGDMFVQFNKAAGAGCRFFRTKHNMSRARLGKELLVSQQQVHKYETAVNRWHLDSILVLLDVFDISLETLLQHGDISHKVCKKLEQSAFVGNYNKVISCIANLQTEMEINAALSILRQIPNIKSKDSIIALTAISGITNNLRTLIKTNNNGG